MIRYIAPSGLRGFNQSHAQHSASLHVGLRVQRPFGTNFTGIDGLIFFHDDKSGAKKIVVSVKGGENVSVAMVRDLKGTIEREKAELGFFVTLAEPTRPMREEAVAAGFYDQARFGAEYPKLQILTIEGLMS